MNMRKWSLFLACYFCVCLLVGCTYHEGTNGPTPQKTEEEEEMTAVFRLVTAGSSTQPAILARVDDDGGNDVFTLDIYSVPDRTLEGVSEEKMALLDWAPQAGALVKVTWDGGVLETYPCQFSGASAVQILKDGFDDTCRLYLDVLEDLWEVDGGLNENIAELGVDLSQTRLSESEQSAVTYVFGTAHSLMAMEGTYQDFVDQGYIDGENFIWEDGCLFSIEESDEPVIFNEADMGPMTTGSVHEGIRFDAEKWRSGLGAYFFMDCTAGRAAGGAWGPYTVGSEAIS